MDKMTLLSIPLLLFKKRRIDWRIRGNKHPVTIAIKIILYAERKIPI
jgi:hypothetical protein